ncbi:hypothetical protein E0Z10_g1301 [Xylaria hypoxylon]|uniref:Acid phosphatase-like protein n=1 Tax=Xylaria hypoxylon TaxID=37992 RepID=A0A4Z0YU27_9PEZI|nr:hypothetical protein E0Z10_g1301 [Xylaria hypoxylon]
MAVSPVGTFFIVLVVLLIAAAVGWIVFTQLRARRLGLPSPPLSSYIPFVRSSHQSAYGAPQPRSGGVRGWISDRFQSVKNPRSAAGAYEQPSAPAGRRGFGALDPDEAWDARVGHETYGVGAYYPEDQELEDRGNRGRVGAPYSGSGYQTNLAREGDGVEESRGRNPNPRSSGLGMPAGRSPAAGEGAHHNPFDDAAAEPSNLSLRGVTPGPIDTRKAAAAGGATHDSPTSISERSDSYTDYGALGERETYFLYAQAN